MIRRLFRAVFLAGLAAAGVAAVRSLRRPSDALPQPAAVPVGGPWPPLHNESPAPDAVVAPEPGGTPITDISAEDAPAPRRTRPLEAPTTWTEPVDGACPDGFPIKAKMGSKIFHAPGQLNYDRTSPDRCYVSTEAAEADGLRAAKR